VKTSPEERRRKILDLLSAGSVSVQELARKLAVSEISIRRDLARLEQEGKLLRVYGGAMANERVAYEFSFKEKEARNRPAKRTIGRAAAGLVSPGDAIFVDTGTTGLVVARALRSTKPSVIVTTNLYVASEYVGQRDVRVLVPGGEVGAVSPDLGGEWTMSALSSITVDVSFVGCDSVDLAEGFYTTDLRGAAVTRLMIKRSRNAYLTVDSSKFGRRSIHRIAGFDKLKGLITDSGLPGRYRKALRKSGVDVIIGTT